MTPSILVDCANHLVVILHYIEARVSVQVWSISIVPPIFSPKTAFRMTCRFGRCILRCFRRDNKSDGVGDIWRPELASVSCFA
jgi:hypothetical protein